MKSALGRGVWDRRTGRTQHLTGPVYEISQLASYVLSLGLCFFRFTLQRSEDKAAMRSLAGVSHGLSPASLSSTPIIVWPKVCAPRGNRNSKKFLPLPDSYSQLIPLGYRCAMCIVMVHSDAFLGGSRHCAQSISAACDVVTSITGQHRTAAY
ncbi:hypothetical protein BDZ89DRAFT_144750 [Hymenopellis radicata]|nr:hypothetical protein BDZ89DRAFT_144750 [Hymenopellis radicata]